MQEIKEYQGLTAAQFQDEILPAGAPAVLRGLVASWPVTAAGKTSKHAFCDYLRRFDRGYEVNTAYGAPSIGGRLFYNNDLSGLNCQLAKARLAASLDFLLQHAEDNPAPTLAIQSVAVDRYLPGFSAENRLPAGFVPDDTGARIWLGNRATIAAHYDPSENIACCIAGTRRFTLFPPEQVANLYIGPFERTPAGAAISMVDFDAPDYESYPRFRDAEAAGYEARLEPGDAIYIPYMWWHHVRSLENLNGLINYWWAPSDKERGDPRNVLLHALLSIRSLPAPYRAAWRSMFEHYVFSDEQEPGGHLPANRRGILGDPEPEDLKQLRMALSRALSRS